MGNTNSMKPQKPPPEEKPEGSTFACEICNELMSSNMKFTNKGLCFHRFCTDCIAKYIKVKVEDDRIADVKCPGLDCKQFLDPLSCRPIIGHHVFDKWCDVLCEKALLGFERCYCPHGDCSEVVVNECKGNVKRSLCPSCRRLFCFQCKLPWHAGYLCEESGQTRDGNDILFGVLAERKKWMRCPDCKQCNEFIERCFIVKCRCTAIFCYECGKKGHSCDCEIAAAEVLVASFFHENPRFSCLISILFLSMLVSFC